MNCTSCNQIGMSGNKQCCGILLSIGETKFIHDGKINETCPKEKNEDSSEEDDFIVGGKPDLYV